MFEERTSSSDVSFEILSEDYNTHLATRPEPNATKPADSRGAG